MPRHSVKRSGGALLWSSGYLASLAVFTPIFEVAPHAVSPPFVPAPPCWSSGVFAIYTTLLSAFDRIYGGHEVSTDQSRIAFESTPTQRVFWCYGVGYPNEDWGAVVTHRLWREMRHSHPRSGSRREELQFTGVQYVSLWTRERVDLMLLSLPYGAAAADGPILSSPVRHAPPRKQTLSHSSPCH